MKNNKEDYSNLWNRTVKLINETKDPKLKKYAEMLLSQRNTAGGKIIEKDLFLLVTENGY